MKKSNVYQMDHEHPEKRKQEIQQLFESIVPTYDLLNRLLSFGVDKIWRRSALRLGGGVKDKTILDVCCGTGDLSRNMRKKKSKAVYSLDFSYNMIAQGRKKGWLDEKSLVGDATMLPFKKESFELLTISFGIRNLPNIKDFATQSLRVLKPGGRLVVIELTRPKNLLVRIGYNFYLHVILPFIGGLISGKWRAYRYLAGTIATFLNADDLSSLLTEAGYSQVKVKTKTFGVATIFVAEKV